MRRRLTPPVLPTTGVLLLALLMRLVGVTRTDVWADESMTLMLIRAAWPDLLTGLPLATDHPPLSFLLFKAGMVALGSEWGLRLLPVALGVAAVWVLMRVAHAIKPEAMMPTGLLAACSPVPVFYSQELRCYSLLFLLTALSLWAAQRVRESPASARNLALFSVLAALAAYTHSVGLFVLPTCAAFLLVGGPRAPATAGGNSSALFKALLRPAGVWLWLLLIAPMVWFNLRGLDAHRQGWWIPPLSSYLAWEYAKQFLGIAVVEHWVATRQPRPIWTGFALERILILSPAILAAAALLACGRAAERREDCRLVSEQGLVAANHPCRPATGLAACALVFFIAMVLTSVLAAPSILVRTLLPMWAPALVLLGLGAAAGRRRAPRVLLCVVLALLVSLWMAGWTWFAWQGPPWRPPTRESYRWVRERLGPHDVLISVPMCEDLTAYYMGDLVPVERLLGTSRPLFAGSPPVRRMVPPTQDPDWPALVRTAVGRAAEASAGEYSVWLIEFGLPAEPTPGSIQAVLGEGHRRAETCFRSDARTATVTRYVPGRE